MDSLAYQSAEGVAKLLHTKDAVRILIELLKEAVDRVRAREQRVHQRVQEQRRQRLHLALDLVLLYHSEQFRDVHASIPILIEDLRPPNKVSATNHSPDRNIR